MEQQIFVLYLSWITKKNEDKVINYDIESIYDYANTNEFSGLQTDELKNSIDSLVTITNNAYNMNLNIGQTELKGVTPTDGVTALKFLGLSSDNPTILYGNTDGGAPGYHYYLGIGFVDCPASICGSELKGMYLHDTVYESPAWDATSSKRKLAIKPWTYVSVAALPTYWKKTGDPNPFKRHHIMLSFPDNSK